MQNSTCASGENNEQAKNANTDYRGDPQPTHGQRRRYSADKLGEITDEEAKNALRAAKWKLRCLKEGLPLDTPEIIKQRKRRSPPEKPAPKVKVITI